MKKLILSLILVFSAITCISAQEINDFYHCQVYSGGNIYTVATRQMRADRDNALAGKLEYSFTAKSSSEQARMDVFFESGEDFTPNLLKFFLADGTELQFPATFTEAENQNPDSAKAFSASIILTYEVLEGLYDSRRPFTVVIADPDGNSYLYKDRGHQYRKIRKQMQGMFEEIEEARAQGRVTPHGNR